MINVECQKKNEYWNGKGEENKLKNVESNHWQKRV